MIKTFTVLILLVTLNFAQTVWQSSVAYFDENDSLVYNKDAEGNRIPDFSYAGYRNGNYPIPEIPVVKTIHPIDGDNTVHIENALFELAMMPKDENGFRGALLLEAGKYEIQGTINLQFDGIVLRGVGDGDDPVAAHGAVALVVHEQDPNVGPGSDRRGDDAAVHVGVAARLPHECCAQVVEALLHPTAPGQDGASG